MNRPKPSLGDYVTLLRPSQWIKNVIVLAGPAAALKLFTPGSAQRAILALVAFCMAASAVYALNDVIDRSADARHPTKKNRPVASGVIPVSSALALSAMLIAAGIALAAFLVNPAVSLILVLYFVMMVAYSVALKRFVLIDVIVLAFGFVLRGWAGGLAVGVPTSEWLIACVFTLCLFMGFGKRRCEVVTMGNSDNAVRHRGTLVSYTPDLLNHLITVSAGIAVMTFLLYTLDTTHSPAPFRKDYLFYTLPIVVYGVFRFALLTELGVHTGPTEIVLKDRWILGTVLLWAIVALGIAYRQSIATWIPWLAG